MARRSVDHLVDPVARSLSSSTFLHVVERLVGLSGTTSGPYRTIRGPCRPNASLHPFDLPLLPVEDLAMRAAWRGAATLTARRRRGSRDGCDGRAIRGADTEVAAWSAWLLIHRS